MTAPDAVQIAVGVHYHVRAHALSAEAAAAHDRARAQLQRAGVDADDVARALRIFQADPQELEREEQRAARVLVAIQAPGVVVDAVEVFERQADEAPEERTARARQHGWNAAVLHRPMDGGGYAAGSAQAMAFVEGYRAFRVALAEFERMQKRQRAREAA